MLVQSEKEAKEFDFDKNPNKYPIYFFKTDTSGEKTYEEFYTDDEDYNINTYDSLGFINTQNIKISFGFLWSYDTAKNQGDRRINAKLLLQ